MPTSCSYLQAISSAFLTNQSASLNADEFTELHELIMSDDAEVTRLSHNILKKLGPHCLHSKTERTTEDGETETDDCGQKLYVITPFNYVTTDDLTFSIDQDGLSVISGATTTSYTLSKPAPRNFSSIVEHFKSTKEILEQKHSIADGVLNQLVESTKSKTNVLIQVDRIEFSLICQGSLGIPNATETQVKSAYQLIQSIVGIAEKHADTQRKLLEVFHSSNMVVVTEKMIEGLALFRAGKETEFRGNCEGLYKILNQSINKASQSLFSTINPNTNLAKTETDNLIRTLSEIRSAQEKSEKDQALKTSRQQVTEERQKTERINEELTRVNQTLLNMTSGAALNPYSGTTGLADFSFVSRASTFARDTVTLSHDEFNSAAQHIQHIIEQSPIIDNHYFTFADSGAQKIEAKLDSLTRAKLYQLASCIHTPHHKLKQRDIEDTTIQQVVIDIVSNEDTHRTFKYLILILHTIFHSKSQTHITNTPEVAQMMKSRSCTFTLKTGINCSETDLTKGLSNLTLKHSLMLLQGKGSAEGTISEIRELFDDISPRPASAGSN